jgi:ATP-dependent helicase HrpA
MGRNLPALKRALGGKTEAILQQEAPVDEGERYTGWTLGDLPELMEISRGGHTLMGYPALVDAADAVTLQVFDSPEKARELHRAGVLRLLAIAFRDRIREIERSLAKDVVLAALKADVVSAALGRTFLQESVPTAQAEFGRRLDEGRSRFTLIAQEIARTASGILAEEASLKKKLAAAAKAFPHQSEDVKQQLARLLAPGWLARTPWERLQHLPRYLKAASMRLDKLRADPGRDARLAAELASLEQPYRREAAARARHGAPAPEFEQFGWLLEELRVSLFAQELKTPVPVSAKRLTKLWQSLRK